jgi:hypothetical protein
MAIAHFAAREGGLDLLAASAENDRQRLADVIFA